MKDSIVFNSSIYTYFIFLAPFIKNAAISQMWDVDAFCWYFPENSLAA